MCIGKASINHMIIEFLFPSGALKESILHATYSIRGMLMSVLYQLSWESVTEIWASKDVLCIMNSINWYTYRRQIDITTYQLLFFLSDTSLCLFGDDIYHLFFKLIVSCKEVSLFTLWIEGKLLTNWYRKEVCSAQYIGK